MACRCPSDPLWAARHCSDGNNYNVNMYYPRSRTSFPVTLLGLLKDEMRGCRDPLKLLTAINVSVTVT